MARGKKFLTLLDWYIIRKFLTTFVFALTLILAICVVFDIAEKIDDFLTEGATAREIIFDYYLNFIPYFGSLFSSLFVFISVIFFTTKLTGHSEIIAMQSGGMSLTRLLRPYLLASALIFGISYMMYNYVIPKANATRIRFENTYISSPDYAEQRNIHRQVRPGLFVYLESYSPYSNTGYNLSIEKFEGKELKSKLWCNTVTWDSVNLCWHMDRYYIRHFLPRGQELEKGEDKDTVFYLDPKDLGQTMKDIETMDLPTLNAHIERQKLEGAVIINHSYVEKYQRLATPFSTFILTIIGVSVSSRKRRGGMGRYLGAGLALSFSYILFQRFSVMFTLNGSMNPLLAVWIPNILYSFIALGLYLMARK